MEWISISIIILIGLYILGIFVYAFIKGLKEETIPTIIGIIILLLILFATSHCHQDYHEGDELYDDGRDEQYVIP